MFEHDAEPRFSMSDPDGEFIGMKRGVCWKCNRPVDYDDDYCWHVEDERYG